MKTKIILFSGAAVLLLALGCSHQPTLEEVSAKYTDQVARAVIDGAWKISGAILLSALARAIFNK